MIRAIMFTIIFCVIGDAAIAGGSPQPNDPYQDRASFREVGPITNAERNAPWPSRHQAAEGYRDVFCKTWDDACTRCVRDPGSRVVDCRPIGDGTACERKSIICTERLSTQARVCLNFSDGCNGNMNGSGAATAVFCDALPQRSWNSTCLLPRASSRPTDRWAKEDLAGHWWLVSPKGDTCVVTFNSIAGMGASEPCSPPLKSRFSAYLNDFSTWPQQACGYEINGEQLDIRCPTLPKAKAKPFAMTFSVRNIENPVGMGRFSGWRLLRISTLW